MTSSTSPIKRFIFDLDGTLFDTKGLVVLAYLRAGVDMPPEAWGQPAQAWLPQIVGKNWKATHRLKTTEYLKLLSKQRPPMLSAASMLRNARGVGITCHILTGASQQSTQLILANQLQTYEYSIIGSGMRVEAKADRLRMLAHPKYMAYIDDDEAACAYIREHVKCNVVHYDPSMTKEELWELSYLPQGAANV